MPPGRCRVFLADDVAGVRVLWRFFLDDEELIEVVGEAGDGRTALVAIAALQPDVVLLDISMPELDGLEVLAHLRAEMPETAVIVASAHTASRLGQSVLDQGAHAYFEKGGTATQLIELIFAACRSIHPSGPQRLTEP